MITPSIRAFYNDIDRYCCDWLSNLMDAGLITPGTISDKSISDLTPDEIKGYERVHLFAGIAGWDYALNLAGWGACSAFTGSCPCQPLSVAGQRQGHADQRHLWPAFHRLIAECRPPVVFGEQVASADGREWLAAVRADLEATGYAVGAANLPACSVGAPHIRQRLWFVADAMQSGRPEGRSIAGNRPLTGGGTIGLVADSGRGRAQHERCGLSGTSREDQGKGDQRQRLRPDIGNGVAAGELADTDAPGRGVERGSGLLDGERAPLRDDAYGRSAGELGNALGEGLQEQRRHGSLPSGEGGTDAREASERTGPWADCVWLPCSDGKARPTQPGVFPLASRIPNRVGRLRAYGNTIVPQVAAEFINAVNDRTSVFRSIN